MIEIFNLFLISVNLFAADGAQLRDVLNKYQKSGLVKISTEKIVKLELLEKENISKGKMYLSSKLFRWDTEVPEKAKLVFDGKVLWSEQPPPEGFDGATQVSKISISKVNKEHQLLLSLFEYVGLTKNFNIENEKKENGDVKFTLTAKNKELSVKKLTMLVNTKEKELKQISYLDDVGNETLIKFTSTAFIKKSDPALFRYSPPKNSQVIPL